MVTQAYDIGDTRRLEATFKDIAGVLTDPTAVTFTMEEPDGTITTYNTVGANLKNPSVGVYHVDWPLAKAGRHAIEFIGTGAVAQTVAYELWAKRSNA